MSLLISGVQTFTTLDYPGLIACVVFLPGCNFRCGYCHNPEFVLPEEINKIKESFISSNTFFHFLDKRKGLLDGVVISGGEPTIQPDLLTFIQKIKERGFKVKLDTNGSNPSIIKKCLKRNLLDYIAMDIKSDVSSYILFCKSNNVSNKIMESIDIIMHSGISYEFRSTLIKEIHSYEVLNNIGKQLPRGALLYLQTFRSRKTLCKTFSQYTSFNSTEIKEIMALFHNYGIQCVIR